MVIRRATGLVAAASMQLLLLLLVLLLASVSTSSAAATAQPQDSASGLRGGVGGGVDCAACTVVVSILESLSVIRSQPIDKILDMVCDWFPEKFRPICTSLVSKYGADVIKLIEAKETPDRVCRFIHICTSDQCALYPETFERDSMSRQPKIPLVGQYQERESPWDWIKELIDRLANKHEPIIDIDNDLYSIFRTLRGADWRGKDCDDEDVNMHAGLQPVDNDVERDSNCNGIYGKDPQTGKPWEELLCGSSNSRYSTIVLGDSAAAHFSIPPRYVTPSLIGPGTYDDLLTVLEDEFDHPHRSGVTGWDQFTPDNFTEKVDSLYLRMRQQNLCNHRDYQNIAVNGARVGAMADNIIQSFSSNSTTDVPKIVVFALIGNDVCTGHHTFSAFTPADEFQASALKALQYLDTVLPAGSHVLMSGLVDGRILWDTMSDRTHPVGVKYSQVYEFLNCLEISPCWGWLNKNETVRNVTSAHAALLSQQYQLIMQNYTFKNFDMHYTDYPLGAVISMWQQMGGETWEIIEPVDGFHPGQIGNALEAEVLWQLLSKETDWLGDPNPNNEKISQLFGDQGGY